MCCQPPNTLLIQCRDYSADALKQSGAIPQDLAVIDASGFDDAVKIIKSLAKGNQEFKNVVIDGASGLSDWLNADVMRESFDGKASKFTDFSRGEATSAIRWQELVNAVTDLVATGAWVFLICHEAVATKKNAQGNDYLKTTLGLHKDKISPFTKYVDAVLFIDTVVVETSVNKLSGVAKVSGGESRVMYTQLSANYEAKNRLNLPAEIPLGNSAQEAFRNFAAAVKAGRSKQ